MARCEVEHMAEFRTLEECEHTREHLGLEEIERLGQRAELQPHAEFVKISRWTRSSGVEHGLENERRQFKVLRRESYWDAVTVGLDRPRVELGHAVELRKGVLRVASGRGLRLSCSKWDRLAPPSAVKARSNECDERELAKALRELGLC